MLPLILHNIVDRSYEAGVRDRQPRFLEHFSCGTVLKCLPVFEVATRKSPGSWGMLVDRYGQVDW